MRFATRIVLCAWVMVVWALVSWTYRQISWLLFALAFASGEMSGGAVAKGIHYLAKALTMLFLLPVGLPFIYLVPGTEVRAAIYLNSPIAAALLIGIWVGLKELRRRDKGRERSRQIVPPKP